MRLFDNIANQTEGNAPSLSTSCVIKQMGAEKQPLICKKQFPSHAAVGALAMTRETRP
jgi:hypothetical protein